MRELTLRAARAKRRMTQKRLAELSGVDQSTISDMETGRHVNPRLDTVNRLAKALEIAPSRLQFTPEPSQSVTKANVRIGHTRRRSDEEESVVS